MKRPANPVIQEEQRFYLCCVCNKKITEIYGRWGNIGGSCSKICEQIKESETKDWGGQPCLKK